MKSKTDILPVIAEILKCSSDDLHDEARIGRFPEWDSFAQVEIVVAIEFFLGKEVNEEEVQHLTSIQGIRNYCNRNIGDPDA